MIFIKIFEFLLKKFKLKMMDFFGFFLHYIFVIFSKKTKKVYPENDRFFAEIFTRSFCQNSRKLSSNTISPNSKQLRSPTNPWKARDA
jgi:hypothetical protein